MRREGWTSSDAAGLPVFPAVVRYDEVARGRVTHALRVTVRRTRRAYVYPARHFAPARTPIRLCRGWASVCACGADFDYSALPASRPGDSRGLKSYGMFVADNGGDWRMSIAPDRRLQGLDWLQKVKGSDFEVVETGARSVEGS